MAGANSGCSFSVDSYQRMAFSNSSCGRDNNNNNHVSGLNRRSGAAPKGRGGTRYHGDVDVGQGEVVHHEVRRDFHGHAGHREGVLPQPGVLEDVGQADEGHVLRPARAGNKTYFSVFTTVTLVGAGSSGWRTL